MGGLMRRRELLKVSSGGALPTVLFELTGPLTVVADYNGRDYGYTFDFADIFGKDFTITLSLTQGSSAGNVSSVFYVGGYRNNSGIGFAKWGASATSNYTFLSSSWQNIDTTVAQSAGLSAKFVLVGRFSNNSATAYAMANGTTNIVNNANFLSQTTSAGTDNITFGKYSWAGTIHDMTIYDGELTAQQISDYLGA